MTPGDYERQQFLSPFLRKDSPRDRYEGDGESMKQEFEARQGRSIEGRRAKSSL